MREIERERERKSMISREQVSDRARKRHKHCMEGPTLN
jgi:hypothetical protein